MTRDARGFTMVEVLMASVIASVVAAGTFAAAVTAAQIVRAERSTTTAEAAGYAQEIVEQFTNEISCDGNWFDDTGGTCLADPAGLTGGGAWQAQALPAGGSESLIGLDPNAKRCFRVTPANCAGTMGDCVKVDVAVCWDGTACPC